MRRLNRRELAKSLIDLVQENSSNGRHLIHDGLIIEINPYTDITGDIEHTINVQSLMGTHFSNDTNYGTWKKKFEYDKETDWIEKIKELISDTGLVKKDKESEISIDTLATSSLNMAKEIMLFYEAYDEIFQEGEIVATYANMGMWEAVVCDIESNADLIIRTHGPLSMSYQLQIIHDSELVLYATKDQQGEVHISYSGDDRFLTSLNAVYFQVKTLEESSDDVLTRFEPGDYGSLVGGSDNELRILPNGDGTPDYNFGTEKLPNYHQFKNEGGKDLINSWLLISGDLEEVEED
jgi:hypothetical protein